MKITPTNIPDVFEIEPKVFGDDRGFFYESFNQKQFDAAIGQHYDFVQDNHSRSTKNVLRGLHYQIQQAQGKLVRCTLGEVFDVAVDMRRNSPTFGQYASAVLTAENKKMFWVPPGFAHGFVTLSESAEFVYKTTDYYAPDHDRSLLWNDPEIGIEWPFEGEAQLSAKDEAGKLFKDADVYEDL